MLYHFLVKKIYGTPHLLSMYCFRDSAVIVVTVAVCNYFASLSSLFVREKQQLVITIGFRLKFQNIKEPLGLHFLLLSYCFCFYVVTGDEKEPKASYLVNLMPRIKLVQLIADLENQISVTSQLFLFLYFSNNSGLSVIYMTYMYQSLEITS